MSGKVGDQKLARLFKEQRRADEAFAPPFRELLARARARSAPQRRRIRWPALAAAAIAIVAAVLLLRPPPPEPSRAVAAATLAAWKAPTDVFLQTPGVELLDRLPVLVSSVPQATLAVSYR